MKTYRCGCLQWLVQQRKPSVNWLLTIWSRMELHYKWATSSFFFFWRSKKTNNYKWYPKTLSKVTSFRNTITSYPSSTLQFRYAILNNLFIVWDIEIQSLVGVLETLCDARQSWRAHIIVILFSGNVKWSMKNYIESNSLVG